MIKDDKLVKMEESAYDSEELLQKLLEDYPDILAGLRLRPVILWFWEIPIFLRPY